MDAFLQTLTFLNLNTFIPGAGTLSMPNDSGLSVSILWAKSLPIEDTPLILHTQGIHLGSTRPNTSTPS